MKGKGYDWWKMTKKSKDASLCLVFAEKACSNKPTIMVELILIWKLNLNFESELQKERTSITLFRKKQIKCVMKVNLKQK